MHIPQKCLVKRCLSDDWKDLSRAQGGAFLRTTPDLMRFPSAKTRVLPSVREVNMCLRAAEVRIRDNELMNELYALRDRVYSAKEYEGHWTSDSIEFHGDYTPDAEVTELQQFEQSKAQGSGDKDDSQHFTYELGDFLAVQPESKYKARFWIVEVVGFGELDDNGYSRTLDIRWYTAGEGEDPLNVTYRAGLNGGRPWIATIHVDTIMLRFGGLTKRNRLSRETVNKLSRSLGSSCNQSQQNRDSF